MIIHASRRPKTPHDYTGAWDIFEWTVEADDYETGRAQVKADVPEGWVLLGVRVEH